MPESTTAIITLIAVTVYLGYLIGVAMSNKTDTQKEELFRLGYEAGQQDATIIQLKDEELEECDVVQLKNGKKLFVQKID